LAGIYKKCSVIVVIRGTIDCERIGNIASGAAIERGNLLAFEFSLWFRRICSDEGLKNTSDLGPETRELGMGDDLGLST
jgi:hypothetical protein